jgi:cytochrome c oxidase assembly factor CtaG
MDTTSLLHHLSDVFLGAGIVLSIVSFRRRGTDNPREKVLLWLGVFLVLVALSTGSLSDFVRGFNDGINGVPRR